MSSHPQPATPQSRRNLAEEITARLRKAIVSGQIAPGTSLAEPVLAGQFGASRAPIREALIALERDGLVEFNDRSRTRVRPLTAHDFEEICTMRMALESIAARIAAAHWTEENTRAVEENIQRQERAATLGELSHLDVEMHEYVVRLAGHRRLLSAWRGIRWQFEMCLAYTHRLQEKLAFEPRQITVVSHRRLLAALASGKPLHAAETMSAHIERSLEWSLAEFPSEPKSPVGNGKKIRQALPLILSLLAFILPRYVDAAASSQDDAFFASKVQPLLSERCFECHSHDKKIKGGLALDSRSGWEKGGDTGPAVVPGKPDESLLIKAISHVDKDLAMPPRKKLSDEEIATLTEWVKMGAPDPRAVVAKIGGMTEAQAKAWWAFQPLPAPSPSPATPAQIDAFIAAGLLKAGLTPALRADPRTLLRRVTFDLTGLPPTPEEVTAFLADDAPDAFARVVERLLASPRYGERWARHWLDVVRYTDSLDTRGFGGEGDVTEAWRYRDWVTRSFNRDLPYDQFIQQQVAGDILQRLPGASYDPDPIIATGMYAIGNWGNGDADKEKAHTDIVDDQIDVTGRAFLGLTLACARCHDHKFDPITTADYYGMAGIFFSSHILDQFAAKTAGEKIMRIPLLSPADEQARAAMQQRIVQIDKELTEDPTDITALDTERRHLTGELKNFPACHGLQEGGIPKTTYAGFHDARIHVRGRYDRLGDTTPRHFPVILAGEKQPPIAEGSGRLELARWLSSPRNPLTARVMANRIWQHHFGEGLVRTPNNFGKLGTAPTHPELLDWLATEFIRSGWSIKAMHRLIVKSATYQQADTSATPASDPDNLLFSRQNRRRLEAESLRDAMLFASGTLDLHDGGPSIRDLTASRRTLYITTVRADRATYQMLFDAADPTAIVEKRIESTVAPQALWLLNHPLVLAQAQALATRARTTASTDPERVRWLYETLYSRPPAPRELDLGVNAISTGDDPAWEAYCQVLLCANEFIYLD